MATRIGSIALLLLLLPLLDASAQGRQMPDKSEFVAQDLEAIHGAVELTAEQSTVVTGILETQFDRQQALFAELRSEGRGGMGAMREKMMALRAEADEAILEVLTEQQRPKFTALREAQRESRGSQRGRRPGQGRPNPQ